jgi:hypothetical protein
MIDLWFLYSPRFNTRWLAYALATVYHETGSTMLPIREWGRGKGKPYGIPDRITGQIYYGRGLVQLTWAVNYAKFSRLLGIDLYHNPDLALEPQPAAKILFSGMINGTFTGKKLGDYFSDTENDLINARRIINGLDQAALIATYYEHFLTALQAATAPANDNPTS